MNAIKKQLFSVIDDIPENYLIEVFDFAMFIKMKSETNDTSLLNASISSTAFWNNEVDDEVWNNV